MHDSALFIPSNYFPSIYHHLLRDIPVQKSRYFSHSQVEPYNSKRKFCACVQRICSNSHLPKQKKRTNISWTKHHKYQITHELFTRTHFRSRVNQVCADDSFSKDVYHKEASHFYLIYKYPTSSSNIPDTFVVSLL